MSANRILISLLWLVPIAFAQNYRTSSSGITISADVEGVSGAYRYYGYFHVSIPDHARTEDPYWLSYSLTSCTGPGASGCVFLSGYGPVPSEVISRSDDTVAISVNAGSLPPTFQVSGPPATVQLFWRKDGYRTERVTGVQTETSYGAYVTRRTGTVTTHSTQCAVLFNGELLSAVRSQWVDRHTGSSNHYFDNRYIYMP